MAGCEYQIEGSDKIYSESEFKKLLSEGYLDKVMMDKGIKIKGIKADEALASSFQIPSAIQPQAPTEVKSDYQIAQDATNEVSKENPDASVLLTPKGEDLSLTAVYVAKENRGKGIGTKVLESVKKQADKLGKKVVLDATTELDEETDLGRLESLYERNGFTKVGDNKFEYNPTAEVTEEVVTPTETVTKTDIKTKSVDELEKRMSEIEGSRDENERREFNEIEKEVDRREWNSVLNAPLNEVNKVLDDLAKKDKEMPNGFGTFIDMADVRQSKAVVNKYSKEVSQQEAIKDFKDAFFGRPTTWYADGLKLREATRAYTEQGGSFKDLLSSVQREFESDGFTEQDAAGVINNKLQEIQNKGLEKAPTETVTKTEEVVTEPTAETKQPVEEATPEAKQKRIETATKNFADFLRAGKIEEGSAMSGIIPPPLWNKAIDIVANSVQSGGVALGKFSDFLDNSIKQIKDSDLFKSLTPKEKGNFTRNIRKELAKYAADQFNLTFNQADIRDAEFNNLKNDLEAAKTTKPTARQLETLKNKAKKFVERNLPDDVYNKSEVLKEINNNFDKAKTVNGIEKALERENKRIENKEFKIETAEAKQAEKERKATIKEIINLTKPTSPKMISKNKRTGVKKANVSLDALRQINEMRDKGLFDKDNLERKTKEELDALKEQIKNIQTEGRAEKKVETATKKEVKKSGEAIILQALDKENKVLDSKEQIIDFMEKYNGVVVVDGQVMSKSSFKDYAKKNPDADYTGTKFYVEKGTELKEQKEEKKGVVRAARELTMGAIRDLDTYMKDISRGSKELRDWTKKNILEPTKVAIYNKVKNTSKLKKEYRNEVEKIFGGFYSAINYLSKDSGISTDVSELQGVNSKKINRDQAVHIYGLINNPDTEKAQKNIDRLKSKNHIDTDEVKALVEGDAKLMAYYEFLKDKYNNQFRREFGPTIENLYGIPLDEGYYWPEPAGTSEKLELNLEGFQNKDISMIAPNMRQRAGYDGAFELVNSYDMYNRYIESMTHAKEFIPVIENSRTLLSDVNRPRILEKLNDTNKYNDLVELMKVIYTDKTPFNNTKMDLLANVTAVKSLWFRLKAIPQQASAFMNYYNAGWVDGINPFQIINSVVPKNSTELDFALDFYRDNPYLWQRFKGASNQDMKAIEASVDSIVNEYGKKFINAGLFAALSPIKAGDFLATSTPLGGGAFAMAQFKNKLKENGGNYQEAKDFALRRWFEETERTQQPAIDKSIVSTVTYDPKYRFFLPFISAQNSMGKKVVKAVKDIQDWKNLTGEEQTQAVADMMYYTLIGSIPFTLMSGSLLTVKDVFDEEDEEARGNMFERISFDLLADNVMSQLQSLSYVGLITNMVLNEMRGREFFNNRPQGETIDSFVGFLSSMVMASSNWDFLSEEMKKDYFARFKLKGKELEEFNALSEEEKIDYLTKNAVKTGFISNESGSMEKFKEEFAKQSRFNRMGKKGMDSFLKATGIDKPMNLYRDVKNYINKNGTLGQLVYGEGAGTVVSAPPFSENIPKQFFDAINYGKDNQLFKYYSNLVSGKPEEYYEIYPSKPGGPISKPVTAPNLDQSKPAAGRIRVKRKRPSGGRVMINEE